MSSAGASLGYYFRKGGNAFMLVLMGKCNNLGGVNVLLGCTKVSVTLIMLLVFI